MKIAVVSTHAPFIWGGAEQLASFAVKHLRAAGADAHLIRVPCRWEPAERLLDEMIAFRRLRLDSYDRVISMKWPAYLIEHPRKTIWLIHQYRQAYDMWDAGQSNITDTRRGRAIRTAIHEMDNRAFAEARNMFVITRQVQARLKKYNGLDAPLIEPPVNDPEIFTGGAMGRYIFAGGRVGAQKRQIMLVEAMRHVRSDLKLVIAGPPDSPTEEQDLRRRVDALGLGDRVVLDLRFLGRDEYARYMNECFACAYLPLDEDSVGYVTAEAFLASKPVITTDDSGGVLEIVLEGDTGAVAEPNPASLADAIERLAADGPRAQRMGRTARQLWIDQGRSWETAVRQLLD